jgi:tryptophanyl-tRNA synthetase
LAEIAEKYSTGKMLTGEVKKILIKVLQDFVADHQEKRKNITDEDVKKFLSTHERKFKYDIKEEVVEEKSELKTETKKV